MLNPPIPAASLPDHQIRTLEATQVNPAGGLPQGQTKHTGLGILHKLSGQVDRHGRTLYASTFRLHFPWCVFLADAPTLDHHEASNITPSVDAQFDCCGAGPVSCRLHFSLHSAYRATSPLGGQLSVDTP